MLFTHLIRTHEYFGQSLHLNKYTYTYRTNTLKYYAHIIVGIFRKKKIQGHLASKHD